MFKCFETAQQTQPWVHWDPTNDRATHCELISGCQSLWEHTPEWKRNMIEGKFNRRGQVIGGAIRQMRGEIL